MSNDLICPYCIRTLKNFAFRCESCGRTTDLRGLNKYALVRFRLNGTIPRCDNPACDRRTLTVLCPFGTESSESVDVCGQALPSDILQYRNYLRFSVLGTTGSGKTNYLTMMIQQLKSAHGEENLSNISIEHVDTMTNTIFRTHLNTILQYKMPVGPTPPEDIVIPQLWRIRQDRKPAASLTVFDGAGENQERPQERIVRYIYGSKQFILLIDPLSIPSLRSRLTREEIMGSSHETDPDGQAELHSGADMVVNIANFIRRNKNIDVNTKIGNPTAVVFTKLDLFLRDFGNSTVTGKSPHLRAGQFVEADSLAVDREIRSWLIENGRNGLVNDGEEFVKAVEDNFSNIRFFGVSSFGTEPSEFKLLSSISPHRVLDPLMWILAQEKIIQTRNPERS